MKIYLIFVTVHLFVWNCESARSTNPNCDFSNPSQRVDGGYSQITQTQCEALGNCFDDTTPNVIWCFRENTGKSRNPSCNFANPQQRVDGGWPQISKLQCESLGYCFDNTIPNVVWCIKSDPKLASSHCYFGNPQTRVDGGFPGITKQGCVAQGNCFDDSTPNTKWCFKYNSGRTQSRTCDFSDPQLRVDGGWPGISKVECESMGNCFDDTIPNVNFCFKPNRPYGQVLDVCEQYVRTFSKYAWNVRNSQHFCAQNVHISRTEFSQFLELCAQYKFDLGIFCIGETSQHNRYCHLDYIYKLQIKFVSSCIVYCVGAI